MAANVRVKLDLRGINAVMTSPGVAALQSQVAHRIAAAAGEGFEVEPKPHPWVDRQYVQAGTARARRAQARDKALTRAVGTVGTAG